MKFVKFDTDFKQKQFIFHDISSKKTCAGGIEYLFLPFGSLAAGVVTDLWGRKLSTITMNIPFIIGWLMLYQANHVWQIFVAFALLGFAIGLTVQVSNK